MLLPEEQKIWDELMVLVESNEAFFYADQSWNYNHFRIFNYRLASYTNFLEPSALECRGIMFSIFGEGHDAEPKKLVCRPPQKFFNYRENPFTMDVDLSTVVDVWDKADGSLISTYQMGPARAVYVKSKGSLHSDQAQAAQRLLGEPENAQFLNDLQQLGCEGYTVNMEYVAPDNRIVIGYDKPDLIVLNVRHRLSGEYMDWDRVVEIFGDRAVHRYQFEEVEGMLEFFNDLPDLTGIEGVVIRTNEGLFMKMKTEAYLTAHRAKDSINSDRRLFEAVLEEATDDLRSLFYDDELALARIEEFEVKVDQIYNHTVDVVERFYERNKELERKDYAILGKEELEKPHFGLAMSKYLGKEVDYKAFMRKNYKSFGIKDDPEPTGDE